MIKTNYLDSELEFSISDLKVREAHAIKIINMMNDIDAIKTIKITLVSYKGLSRNDFNTGLTFNIINKEDANSIVNAFYDMIKLDRRMLSDEISDLYHIANEFNYRR